MHMRHRQASVYPIYLCQDRSKTHQPGHGVQAVSGGVAASAAAGPARDRQQPSQLQLPEAEHANCLGYVQCFQA